MEEIKITSAQYTKSFDTGENNNIYATIDGVECLVPIDENNTDYIRIMEYVKAGKLTIKDAD